MTNRMSCGMSVLKSVVHEASSALTVMLIFVLFVSCCLVDGEEANGSSTYPAASSEVQESFCSAQKTLTDLSKSDTPFPDPYDGSYGEEIIIVPSAAFPGTFACDDRTYTMNVTVDETDPNHAVYTVMQDGEANNEEGSYMQANGVKVNLTSVINCDAKADVKMFEIGVNCNSAYPYGA